MNNLHEGVRISYSFLKWLYSKIDNFLEKHPEACEDCREYLAEILEELDEFIEVLEKGE